MSIFKKKRERIQSMKYIVNGKALNLDPKEVKLSKRYLSRLFLRIKKQSEEKNCPTFFFTFLIVANLLAQEALNEMEPDTLEMITNRLERRRK